MEATGNGDFDNLEGETVEVLIPGCAKETLAEAFVAAVLEASSNPRSHYLQHFVRILHEIHADSNTMEYIARLSGRSLDYLRDLRLRGPLLDLAVSYRPGTQRPRRAIDSVIERFLILKSRCKTNFRVLDAHVGVDIAAEFFEFVLGENPAAASYQFSAVTEKHINKMRRRIHVRLCPHEYLDVYSCDCCREGVREYLRAKMLADPLNLELQAELTQLDLHIAVKKAQISYYFHRLRDLRADEAIAIIDHSKSMSMQDRYPLCAIVVITKPVDSDKYVYEHYLYGAAVGYAGTWKMAQIALQDFFRTVGVRYRRIDMFHDSFYGDFRNSYMMLFYSIATHAFRTIPRLHALCYSSLTFAVRNRYSCALLPEIAR